MVRQLLLIAVAGLLPVKLACATLPLANPSSDPSSRFGAEVKTLVNGNIVVTDPALTVNGFSLAGAVYLFNGTTGALISTLAGSAANEMVGGGGIGVLTNGNFVALSISSGAEGALGFGPTATFVNGTTGLTGVVSGSNSLLMGSGDAGAGGNTMVPCLSGQPNLTDAGCATALGNVRFPSPAASSITASGSPRSILSTPPYTNEIFNFIPLPNGNYLILNLDAVTFGDGTVGVSGPVTISNSLFGGPSDFVGASQTILTDQAFEFNSGITVLPNSTYIVYSGTTGTVTFGSGTTGAAGQIPTARSIASGDLGLVETLPNGNIVVVTATAVMLVNGSTLTAISTLTTPPTTGFTSIPWVLSNGNFVVTSPDFGGGQGAATFVNGVTGLNGTVSASNSLVGAVAGDMIGSSNVQALANGNYLVSSGSFGNNRGAVTFANGTTGLIGVVSAANSLVGAATTDQLGLFGEGVKTLSNGNYVVFDTNFGGTLGAVTFGNGTTGTVGVVSAANSLIGASAGDSIGSADSIGLFGDFNTSNFVVLSPNFDHGRGAATFVSGSTGLTGVVSPANSLVGAAAGDRIGSGFALELENGNFVVESPEYGGGLGAISFINTATGTTGVVSSGNSLIGSTANGPVGGGVSYDENIEFQYPLSTETGINFSESGDIVPLGNGNYVVLTPNFAGGAGAATFGNGATGTVGVINSSNSLVGSAPGDHVGGGGVKALPTNGSYVVMSPFWAGGKGAVTFGNGAIGITGTVSASNSLVGASAGDLVGFTGWNFSQGVLGKNPTSARIFQKLFAQGGGSGNSLADLNQPGLTINSQLSNLPGQTTVLSNGDYVVASPWFNGEQGAVTLGSGTSGVTGVVSASNSTLGSLPVGFFGSSVVEDQTNQDKFVASGWVELHQHATQVSVIGLGAPVTIQTSPSGLQFSVDGGVAKMSPQTLNLLQGQHTISMTATQAGTAGSQSVFTAWNDGSMAASRLITVGSTSATYTASFKSQYQLTISASPAAGGNVTPPSGTFYDSGSAVSIGATANNGYSFTNWTGPVAGASRAATTVTMSAPQTVTANFTANNTGHPAFFSGEDFLSGIVYYLQFPDSNLFGYYEYLSSSILYHFDMGYEAFIPSTAGSIYFYDFASGHWWYSSASLFPNLYDFTFGTWIYYFPDTKNDGHYTTNPRYFVNLTTQKIFTL